MTARSVAATVPIVGAALAAAPAAGATTRKFWIAATPVTPNMAPNGRDHITGTPLDRARRVRRR